MTSSAPRIAIIGAGFGGVAAAVYLTKSGCHDIVIYERHRGVGGVWHQNTYPGAEVDTFSDWYSYKFKPYDWPKPHSPQAVLEEYINATIDEYHLRDRLELGVSVRKLVWSDARQAYAVHLDDGRVEEFQVVISAIGLFNVPNHPTWPGLEDFRGPAFHASNYEHHHDLVGKRVAVVGAGSSGTQIVPQLAKTASHLYAFQRDPNWIVPKGDVDYTPEERTARRRPRVYAKARRAHWLAETKMLRGGKILREGTPENLAAQKFAQGYIDTMFADRPELKELVTPNHPFFAKRPVKADGFYDALLQDNVTFVRSAVTSVTADAIVDANGKRYEVDAIVLATGFRVAEFLREIEVYGRDGCSIHDFWDAQGGPEAFLGLTVPKFPNFYMLYGPNTNMGQIVFNLETQARYVARDVRRMRRTGATSLEVRPWAHREFNRRLQVALRKTVWPEANNYLKAATGKLVVPFPRPMVYYWALSRLLRWPSTRATRKAVAPAAPAAPADRPRPLAEQSTS